MLGHSIHEGMVASVNVAAQTGVCKRPVPDIRIDLSGVEGDAHAGPWHRQVSLLALESIERFSASAGRAFQCGEFAENISTRGLDLSPVTLLDRFLIGEPQADAPPVELEVTQIGKACHPDGCAIFREVGQCVMPKEGIFCRVLRGGGVKPADPIRLVPKTLRIRVLTLSDRASRGAYPDRSGPRMVELLDEFFAGKRWRVETSCAVLPDDEGPLREALEAARTDALDAVFTTGGTGIGPRDITPDVIGAMADRLIPGIMEHIRVKFGAEKPNALLSRSVAAVMGQTLVYALPGSVRAVSEYMGEILKTFEHALLMIHGIDAH